MATCFQYSDLLVKKKYLFNHQRGDERINFKKQDKEKFEQGLQQKISKQCWHGIQNMEIGLFEQKNCRIY